MRGGKSGSRKGKGKGKGGAKSKGCPNGAGKGKGKGKGRANKGAGKGKGGWPRQWYPQTTWHYGWQPQHHQLQKKKKQLYLLQERDHRNQYIDLCRILVKMMMTILEMLM